ncbi:MAG: alpha/beta fold hydrolase [Kiritimatiellia bacterium]
MRERVVSFGNRLVGVLCEPELSVRVAGAPVLIVSNIGMLHRPASYRLYVELARRLAQRGLATLRFDVSGLGDSAPRTDALSDLEGAVADTRAAMQWLVEQKMGKRFVLLGLCSGVDAAHTLAVSDERVTGAVFIDGYTYPTFKYRLREPLLKFFTLRRWLRRGARYVRRYHLGDLFQGQKAIYVRNYPTRVQLAADIETMLQRGKKLLFIYTSGIGHVFNYREQFFDMLAPARFEGRLELEYYYEADHLFSDPSQRERLWQRLESFVTTHWLPAGTLAAARSPNPREIE